MQHVDSDSIFHVTDSSMRFFAVLAVLYCYFLLARVVPHSPIDSLKLLAKLETPLNVRFAPESAVVSPQVLLCSNWKRGRLMLRSTGRLPFLLCSILLLTAGDIEINPGPVKYPCGRCCKAVKSNQRGIFCEVCYQWFHTRCINMSNPEYQRLSLSDEGWCCHDCFKGAFPFNDTTCLMPLTHPLAPASPTTRRLLDVAQFSTPIAVA